MRVREYEDGTRPRRRILGKWHLVATSGWPGVMDEDILDEAVKLRCTPYRVQILRAPAIDDLGRSVVQQEGHIFCKTEVQECERGERSYDEGGGTRRRSRLP